MSYTGVLDLLASKKNERTIISSCYYEGALKIARPIYLEEDSPSIYLIHVGGGYVNGDSYFTQIQVDDGAHLVVTTQSSTKVYKTPTEPVRQMTKIKLGSGSVLEYIPDPLIAYEDARFIQETEVELEHDSCFFYSDSMTPGWAEDGSFFKYEWIRSKLKIYRDGVLVLFDHLLLEPDDQMSGIMQMEGYTHTGTFVLIHEGANKKFLDHLYDHLNEKYPDVHFGLSALPDQGVIMRLLANHSGVIEAIIAEAQTYARRVLLNKESILWRKY
ncbi:urease accessory protein UreD [Litchfieldia salsa]|uniref:Urease accessory protein UreD n=1 Tax=Litchfieldia salsa TaxID=930152 RepID=A0A1H0PUG2_9BACI|nr:urease accessory protein UreD [Litchfieldia salsa]SDP08733.1 urease accessory protein [Litchfieldia salsa]